MRLKKGVILLRECDFRVKVVWDIDDVMWRQNYEASRSCGIPFEKLVDFHANENPLLTDAEKARLNACYADPEHFRDIQWGAGLEKIPDLAKCGVTSQLNSNSFSAMVRGLKVAQLRWQIPRIEELEQRFGLVNDKTTIKKRFDDDAVILVDDSPYNAHIFPGHYVVTPFTPWIRTDKAQSLLSGKEVHYFTYGYPEEAIEVVRLLAMRLSREI